jgi:hypothetical protein
LVFDEATTFFNYIQSGNFLPGTAFWSANNHFLNSLLAYLSFQAFGMEEWVLRLPNLLVFPLAAWFGFRLIGQLQNPFLKWWALILFFSSHYLLEFFAYTRGYGLMLCFLLGSLVYLQKLNTAFSARSFWWFWSCLSLALLANISCLPLAGLMALFGALKVYQSKDRSWPIKLTYYLALALSLSYAIWMSLALKAHGQLYYGGEKGFIEDSLSSLNQALLGSAFPLDILLAAGALYLIALGLYLRKCQSLPWQDARFLMALGFLAISIFYPLGHWLIGLKFPFDRALIYWMAFGLISKLALLDAAEAKGLKGLRFFLLWTLVFPISWFQKAHLEKASFQGWAQEQIPEAYYRYVQARELQSISGSYLLAPQWYFYQVKQGADLAAFQKSDKALGEAHLSVKPPLDSSYEEVVHYEQVALKLWYKPRAKKEQEVLLELSESQEVAQSLPLITLPKEEVPEHLEIKLKLRLPRPGQDLSIALQQFNKAQESIHFQAYEAKHYFGRSTEWQEWRLFVALKDLQEDCESLKLFLWNPHSESFSLKEVQVLAINTSLNN